MEKETDSTIASDRMAMCGIIVLVLASVYLGFAIATFVYLTCADLLV